MSLRTAAIVGCGGIAGRYDELATDGGVYSHAGAYRARGSRVKVVACVEPDADRRQQFQRAWNIDRGYAALDDMLRETAVDILSICTPDGCHADHLTRVLAARGARIIWAEKPLTTAAGDAADVLKKAAAAQVGICLTNQRRWDPAHRQLAGEIGGGSLGQLVSVRGYYVKGLVHIGTTMINTLRLLAGEVRQVQAIEPFDKGSYAGDASLNAVLWFDSGVTGAIHGADRDVYRFSVFEIDIVGTDGRARILANGDRIVIERPRPYTHYDGFSELQESEVRSTGMAHAMEMGLDRMLAALDSGDTADLSEAVDGARDLTIVDAIKASARAGGTKVATAPC